MRKTRGHAGESGFTVVEIIAAIGVTVTVIAAGIATYVGTMRSWEGTSGLAEVQREASVAMDLIGRSVRNGSWAEIGGDDDDSLSVFVETAGGDSLAAAYYLSDGALCDINGTVLVPNVSTLVFGSEDGRTVNIDVTLTDSMGTDAETDDQSVLMSSSVACRN